MQTLLQLENGNCSFCHNKVVAELRKREHVASVHSDFSKGCLVIEHDEDPGALASLVTNTARAVEVAANGERVMVFVDAHEEQECPYRTPS